MCIECQIGLQAVQRREIALVLFRQARGNGQVLKESVLVSSSTMELYFLDDFYSILLWRMQ